MKPPHDTERLLATIIILESELRQARDTVEFLHNCLTNKQYIYDYPEQTLKHLQDWGHMLPERGMCVHSFFAPGCEACINRVAASSVMTWAQNILGGE